MRSALVAISGSTLLSAMLLVPAFSQELASPWGDSGAALTKGDLALVMGASNDVNASGTRETKSWSNPATGASGTVALARAFQSGGMQCHEVNYTFQFTRPAHHSAYVLTWCQVGPDTWKIRS